MASSAKDIQLRELKDTVSQLKTMISEQTELIRSLRLMLDEKSSHEKALQEQVDYLTKKLLGEPDEELDDEYEDFDFDDEEEDAEDKSREYVTLDFEEDEQEASDEEESEDDEE